MLKGKNAVVTGATRGIGRAIALEYAKNGANVCFTYRSSPESAESLSKEIEAFGVKALAVKCDVADFNQSKALLDACKENFGKVDILVNNAGITADGLIMRMSEESFDSVIDTNLKGTFNCTKHASALMVRQKCGTIINITSVVGIFGNAGQANYAASKAGVIGLTKSVSKEVGSRGITVNAIAPGFIQTDMTAALSDKNKDDLFGKMSIKRLGEAQDIADLAVFLASDKAKYITGQVISVDGGLTI